MEGCLGDPRGFSGRKYGGKFYRCWRVFTSKQTNGFDSEKQLVLTRENLDLATTERNRLKGIGFKVRMVKVQGDDLIVLFVFKD